MSKMKSWNDEPAIQQKEYSQEKYNKKKRDLFGLLNCLVIQESWQQFSVGTVCCLLFCF